MWTSTYSKTFKRIKRQDIWRLWTDINNWPKWHGKLDYCKLEGKFAVGNHFLLKPKGRSPVKITVTQIDEGYSFSDCTTFFGAKMHNTHSLEETKEGLKLSNTIIATGPLRWLWIKLVVQNVANSIPEKTAALVKLATGKK